MEEGNMPDQKFIDEVVKAHNEYRSRHQAPSISHAKDLTKYAQKWADHLASIDSLEHSDCKHSGQTLGENIAMKWSSNPGAYSGQEATDQWYSEIKVHTFGTEPSSLNSGHFTQVVWKGSTELGVGKAAAKNGNTYVVASYRPAGNMMGTYSQNVLPPKDGKIILPVQKGKGSATPCSSHFGGEDPFSGARGGGTERKTTKTYTTTEGSGPNAVVKTVVEETIVKADGSKVTTKKETVTTGGAAPSAFKDEDQFGRLSLQDDTQKRSLLQICCHFTQIVWKGSKEMGIGKAKTSGGKVIVVASHRPAGNFVGKFMENVAPLKH